MHPKHALSTPSPVGDDPCCGPASKATACCATEAPEACATPESCVSEAAQGAGCGCGS